MPQPAVVVRDGFSYVFRVNPDNRVAQVKVQTGRLAGDRVEITVAACRPTRASSPAARGFLNDGDLVRVVDGRPPPRAGAAAAAAAAK